MPTPDISIDANGYATAHTDKGRYVLGTVVYLSPRATKAFLDWNDESNLDVAAFAHHAIVSKSTDRET